MLSIPAQDEPAIRGKQPAHQHAYERLRDRILFGELIPGQPVTLKGLTQSLEAGMTPVREAVRRLTSEGALSMKGNRRVIVPELSAGCIEQLEFMRLSIEPELAVRAARTIRRGEIDALETQDRSLNAAISHGDVAGYLLHNYRFHHRFYEHAGAPILAATVDKLWLRFGPSMRVVCGRYGTFHLPDRHADLLAALRRGDEAAAARALREDIAQGMTQMRAALHGEGAEDRFD